MSAAGPGIGSGCWGRVADRWGRRVVFAATVLTLSLFTGVAGLTFLLAYETRGYLELVSRGAA